MAKAATHQGIPLIGPILNKIIGTRNERFVKKYTQRVQAINSLEPETRALTDGQIRAKLQEFRDRRAKGTSAIDLMIEAFAVAREAMDRSVGIRNVLDPARGFDVSLLPASAREVYATVRAQAEALPPAMPEGSFLGMTEPSPGWRQVDIPNELYDAVREAFPESRPPFRARPFDVQLIGAMVLYQGKIAEMKTGEGKTIVAPLATYLACIENLKVHVVTVNDYLVQRDRDWTFPFFHALGLTVGAIHPMHMQNEDVKRRMYQCDVVYGTTAEFGFDYLRDNMKRTAEQQVQRRREFAIVDEVDSILIDEARTPLIISGPAHEDAPRYELADRLARHLVEKQRPWQQGDDAVQACLRRIKGLEGDIRNVRDKARVPALQEQLKQTRAELPALEKARAAHVQYYEVEMERKSVHVTHQGTAEAQRAAGIGSFYVGENMDLPHLLEQSLRAHVVYQRDRDYIVIPQEDPMTGRMEDSVVIVDTFTGRPMVGRQWSDGLHQACETKEKVPIKQETQTVATVTIQNFFKMYKRLAGMTGTADTEAQEFHDIYQLDVVSIPTNRAVVRRDHDDLMFISGKDKWGFIVDEIKAFHDVGRPVLVGTTSVEKSETLSQMLAKAHQVKHEVLNAKQHEREANIVENAGQLGAVMIATNMAGRGTDIKLGPLSREALLDHWLRRGLAPRTVTVESTDDQLKEAVYRKIAPGELDVPKREVEAMEFAKLELDLLRHWATKHTWLSEKKVNTLDAEGLRKALDEHGRFLLHRIRWFKTIEDLGGLHVIGTERHESRRIDNQLRGRGGRQGDKGSSRFFVSFDDDLMKLFAGDRTLKILSALGMKEGDAIEHPMLSKSVEGAQRKVEERNFQYRKQVLEYDEIMEHQRQTFYGLRQRVIEGDNVRGLIFDYVADAVDDAVDTYLGRDYPATCAVEYAAEALDCAVPIERLRGRDGPDLIARIREDAKSDARANIAITIGEYMPDDDADSASRDIDFDAAGLVAWAKSHFGVDLDIEQLRTAGVASRRQIEEKLVEAAIHRIDEADLSKVETFVAEGYGAEQLARWAERKFGITLDTAQIGRVMQDKGADGVVQMIVEKTDALYRDREVELPVDFALQTAMMVMRQDPQAGLDRLVQWANSRFRLGWTAETVKATPPQKARELLLEASRKWVESDQLSKEIHDAVAITDNEALDAHFREQLGFGITDEIRRASGPDREQAIRARIETSLRMELLFFERTLLLNTLDPLWKDHLYAMDQLRGAISFRAFSQQDPRIEYKREGARMFKDMLQSVRNRVTDDVLKVRLAMPSPGLGGARAPAPVQQPPAIRQAPANGRPQGAPMPSANPVGSMIMGPGLAPMPVPAREQRDLEAAQLAGTDPAAKPAQVVKSEKRLGRNDPCPQGSGRKYKKCCNRPDGVCTGDGLNTPPPQGDSEGDDN
ncbi:MAG: preprotein translocase subunit SecA [Phycisphaeraceae bacterium]|nr:preprotein translocase subunit SecA [Phycisphaeraceae bacterium]